MREDRASHEQPIRLSACLIVRDEEKRLPECLASVAFCDEVVVVDSGSTDRTKEIARAAGAVVVEHAWQGFAGQRNVALDAARGEWALEVDADERVTPSLREEILKLVTNPPPGIDNAVLPLRQVFLGARLGPSALYPAGRTRLFRRDRYRHDRRRAVHEGLWPTGRSAYLHGDLEHVLSDSLRESLRDLRRYTWLESLQIDAETGIRAALIGAAIRPATKFVYRSWLLGGWRDGWPGITKILLDCVYDSLTWVRFLNSRGGVRRRTSQPGSSANATLGRRHFGHSIGYRGPVRVLAVARGAAQAVGAQAWLEAAAREGADVVMVTDAPVVPPTVRTVHVERFGVLVLRAIAAESQRNPIEVLACPSRTERVLCRLLPAQLRGFAAPGSLASGPRELMESALNRRQSARQPG